MFYHEMASGNSIDAIWDQHLWICVSRIPMMTKNRRMNFSNYWKQNWSKTIKTSWTGQTLFTRNRLNLFQTVSLFRKVIYNKPISGRLDLKITSGNNSYPSRESGVYCFEYLSNNAPFYKYVENHNGKKMSPNNSKHEESSFCFDFHVL